MADVTSRCDTAVLTFVECSDPPGAQIGLTSANCVATIALVIPGWDAAATACLSHTIRRGNTCLV